MPDSTLPLVIISVTLSSKTLGANEERMARALSAYNGMRIKARLAEFLRGELADVGAFADFAVHVTDGDD